MYNPLERAFTIIEFLARSREGHSLTSITAELDLAKGTAHRMLRSLVDAGFVYQDADSERYHLTLRLPVIGFRLLATIGVTDVVQPILDRLAAESQELVRLGLIDGDDLIWTAWSQGSRDTLRYIPDFGKETVLHTTASGTAWLASLADAEALRIYRKHQEEADAAGRPYGPRITGKALLEKLAIVRRKGFGLNHELSERGINAMAVVVSAPNAKADRVVGTLSIAGPSIRLTKQRLTDLLPVLQARARELGEIWPIHEQMVASRS